MAALMKSARKIQNQTRKIFLGVGPYLADPPPYNREQMDRIFIDYVNQKFWKIRTSISDSLAPKTPRLSESLSKILPHPVTKVPTSHFEPRISLTLPVQPVHERSTYFNRGEGHQHYPCQVLFRTSDFELRISVCRSRLLTLLHALPRYFLWGGDCIAFCAIPFSRFPNVATRYVTRSLRYSASSALSAVQSLQPPFASLPLVQIPFPLQSDRKSSIENRKSPTHARHTVRSRKTRGKNTRNTP